MDYYKLRTKLEDELEKETAKMGGEMSPSGLCVVKDLLCAIQYAATIPAMDGSLETENGYSQRASYGVNPGNSYNSYARGAQPRDSMGRYSGRMRYSRDDAAERMIPKLESMMNMATTERSREAIRQAIEAIEME